MSDGIKAAHEAEEEYEFLCEKYNEDPEFAQSTHGKMLDIYGEHHQNLKNKLNEEIEIEIETLRKP